MNITVPSSEYPWLTRVEDNIAAHLCIVNDLYSWEKELLTADQAPDGFGGDLVNAISIVSREEHVDVQTAKQRLARKVNEVEKLHFELLEERKSRSEPMSYDLQKYLAFLEDLASGNESWSRVTARYNIVCGKFQRSSEENLSFRT